MSLPVDNFTKAMRMAKVEEGRHGASFGPWHWEAIRRGHAATVFDAQAAERDTAWQARRGDRVYTILEIPDAITLSAH
jgi:hypothetical protein